MTPIPQELLDRVIEGCRLRDHDEEAESVLADWAESVGFYGLAAGLRAESRNVRWSTVATLARFVDPSWVGVFSPRSSPACTEVEGRLV